MNEDKKNLSYRTFYFRPKKSGDVSEIVEVIIPESLNIGYNQFVWPCAPVLAQYVHHRRAFVAHKIILELGCGTALPGIVAAKLGAMVTLTDLPSCINRTRESCIVNGLPDIDVFGITWGQFSQELLSMKDVDVILGSDCFYDSKDFEPIIATVSFLLDKRPTAEFWLTYQVRSTDKNISALLHKWSLRCTLVPSSAFIDDDISDQCSGYQDVQLLVITKKSV